MNAPTDIDRLNDIRHAATRIQAIMAADPTPEDVSLGRRLYAVCYLLGVVGEAAACVSNETKALRPQAPWSAMKGMRNRLVHEYWRVSEAVVLRTASLDMTPLVADMDALLAVLPAPAP